MPFYLWLLFFLAGSKGVINWQTNLFTLVTHFIALREKAKTGELKLNPTAVNYVEGDMTAYLLRNKSLSTITHNYRHTHQFMVAIKSMQALTKKLKVCFCDFHWVTKKRRNEKCPELKIILCFLIY